MGLFDIFKTEKSVNSYLSINEIKYNNNFNISFRDLRSKIKLLVIDDEDFTKENSLRKLGYNISVHKDLINISDLKDYDIILCDINGVGKSLFGINGDGTKLIKEIRKFYPTKYIIAYSGETHSVSKSEFFSLADSWIDKNEYDEDKWIDLLDNAAKKLIDKTYHWEKTRTALLNNEVKMIDVIKMEDAYVRSIQNTNFRTFPPQELKSNFNHDSWELIKNITPLIIKIIGENI